MSQKLGSIEAGGTKFVLAAADKRIRLVLKNEFQLKIPRRL